MARQEGFEAFPLRLVTPGDHRELFYEPASGGYSLRTADGDACFPIEDEIPLFCPVPAVDEAFEKRVIQDLRGTELTVDSLIEQQWTNTEHPTPTDDVAGLREAMLLGGPILDVASGPGGGLAAFALRLDTNAEVVMNDISLWPLRRWQKLARRKGCWPNLRFAQFDARTMPLASNTVPVVVSRCGISETADGYAVISEIFRVLRPGGRFQAAESMPEIRGTANSVPGFREACRHRFQFVPDYGEALRDAGFESIRVNATGGRPIVPGEGALADFTEEFKVDVYLRECSLTATKPA